MFPVISWQEIKRRASYHYYSFITRKFRKRNHPKTQGAPLVVGLLSSPNGIGQGARLLHKGLVASGYNVSVLDLTPVIQPELSTLPLPSALPDDGKGPIILHLNPSEVPKALHVLRDRNLLGRRLIGIWAWELEHVPSSWSECATWFDEIWSISEFSQKSFQNLPVPVVRMGYPIQPIQRGLETDWKVKLNLQDKFCILTVFDSRSSLTRKNPQGTIIAFQKAFSSQSDVVLIVKVNGPLPESEQSWLETSNIIVISDNLSSEAMTDLICSVDCYLSLTRAEGFGLVAAEAAVNKVPTIITGWSAPSEWKDAPNVSLIDFILVKADDAHAVYDSKKGRRWAEPNIDDAVKCLKEVYASREAEPNLDKIATWWETHHGLKAFIGRLSDDTRSALKPVSDKQ